MAIPVRQFFSVTLVLSLLSANGLYFAPLFNASKQSSKGSASMQNCCCCTSGGEMAGKCCCASRQSAVNDRSTCSFASAPCTAPVAVLSPNVLDQWIDPSPESTEFAVKSAEKFPFVRESLLSGITNFPFHPPQSIPLFLS